MGEIALRLIKRDNEPQAIAHFLIQCVFCMFAEDAKILPEKLFETVMDRSNPDGGKAQKRLAELFAAMRQGGEFALNDIPWFNGGLFENIAIPALQTADVVALLDAARLDWSQIEPAILGTLFERGLNPDMRSQLGAHYTDPATIMKLIRPVVEQPLLAEWEGVKKTIITAKKDKDRQAAFIGFLERLKAFRVLDPACGSGNFLYLALKTLKDIEHRVNIEAEALGLHRELGIGVSPANVTGIEINPYAAELARVTVWIGEIQWMLAHGYPHRKDPILAPLDHIECRDAIMELSAVSDQLSAKTAAEADWPVVDAIVGNPPFLGDKKMIGELGLEYIGVLRELYKNRVPGGADLVTYWFEKARAHIEQGKAKYAGLVATNSIRQKRNRPVLERIVASGRIYEAWSDEEWVNAGAAVRVSLVCFGSAGGLACNADDSPPDGGHAGEAACATLDGQPVAAIHADLTAGSGLDLTQARPLKENAGGSYFGLCLAGPFKVSSVIASGWLKLPNPHGKPNSDVLKPIYNGSDITRRWAGDWVIDFGLMEEQQAALYEAPFAHVVQHVKPIRIINNRKARAEKWWRHGEARPGLRTKLAGLQRYIATPETAKHRFFVWFPLSVAPEHSLIVIPRDDDATFGILSSRIHTVWALAAGGRMGYGNDPRYNSSVTFETFPFPAGLTPQDALTRPAGHPLPPKGEGCSSPSPASGRGVGERETASLSDAIAAAAQRLNELRNNWLNPPEWTVRVPEVAEGYPDRILPKPGHEADLKKRTLTNLYNQRPAWLDNAHKELDQAVAAAYGWADYMPDMPDEEILRRLLRLNQERSE